MMTSCVVLMTSCVVLMISNVVLMSSCARSQDGFLQYVVKPLVQGYCTAISNNDLVNCLDRNIDYWRSCLSGASVL